MSFSVAGTSIGFTVAQFCDRILEEHLERTHPVHLDVLDGAVTTGDAAISVTYGAEIRPGTRVELDDELMHVFSWSTPSATVRRGLGGTTAASHNDTSLIKINPRFPRQVIAETLRREIRTWPNSVYVPIAGDFPSSTASSAFDLDGLSGYEVLRLCRAQRTHPRAQVESWPTLKGNIDRRQNTTSFPSGYAFRVTDHGPRWNEPTDISQSYTVRLVVGIRHPIPASLDFADDLGTDYFLTQAQADAAFFGVAGTLLLTEESNRTSDRTQARPRRAEEVPPGHMLQAGQALLAQRNEILGREAERLYNEYAPTYR